MSRLAAKPLPLLCAGLLCAALGACAAKPVALPANVTVSAREPRSMPSPPSAAPNATPRIVRVWMSTLTIEAGTWLDGAAIVSTNVASLEVRTAAFSINADHVAPGVFRFHTHVLELPPLARRHTLDLSIIARNARGDASTEYTQIAIR